ncbi:hypothetical protein EV2_023254 [Malus domestica]
MRKNSTSGSFTYNQIPTRKSINDLVGLGFSPRRFCIWVWSSLKQCNLLRALQSEIQYELSSNPFQQRGSSSLGDFVVEWDSPRS